MTTSSTEPVVEAVLQKANTFFKQEAHKPQVDTASLKVEARKLVANIRKCHAFIEEEPDEALCRSHNARIKELQGRLNNVQAKIHDADRRNRKPPKALNLDRSTAYVPDLGELLNQEVPMAAEAIRTLTGPITIHQEKVPGRPGARWIATFSPRPRGVASEGCPGQELPPMLPASPRLWWRRSRSRW